MPLPDSVQVLLSVMTSYLNGLRQAGMLDTRPLKEYLKGKRISPDGHEYLSVSDAGGLAALHYDEQQ